MKKRLLQVISACLGTVVLFTGMYSAGALEALERLVKNNVKEGTTITLPVNEPTKDGFEFGGWQIKGTFGGGDLIYKSGQTVTIDEKLPSVDDTITFTAIWNEIPEEYTVKYAVRIYGIKQDEDEAGNKIGLTFGPAGGYGSGTSHSYCYAGTYTSSSSSYGRNDKYRSCGDDDPTCLHNMTWEQIAEVAKTNPESFKKCMYNRCTKAVPFNITGSIAGTTYAGQMDDCDGASSLYNSIASNYRKWNDSRVTVGGWRDSKIRNTLTGATNDVIVSHGGTLIEDQSLYAMLPQVLKDNIVPKKVISATTSTRSGDNLTTTYDKLWLFSSYEMYKPDGYRYNSTYIDEREGQLYQSQDKLDAVGTSSAGSTTMNRFYSESGSTIYPWSRSLYSGAGAVDFNDGGYPYNLDASFAHGVAPGFCLGRVTE